MADSVITTSANESRPISNSCWVTGMTGITSLVHRPRPQWFMWSVPKKATWCMCRLAFIALQHVRVSSTLLVVSRNKLKWAPLEFLLTPHYCGLGAGFIPFRAIANNKQCETRELFMSLVIHDWIGNVQDSQGVSASEMTDIVSGRA